ncbi:hypothetical protein RhiirA4_490599 [Rhizophagus irregularis]|uniref:Uncharacterized protein n=1 Tax=Rhizophagus irregularis TaxID=588596 RepID=A0A2I1HVS8_9GLOM|nr:hypothetical protein RhiirA4_490599 [Rhizophagus irregularis]
MRVNVSTQVQSDDDLFKSIKLTITEFVGRGSVGEKFNIKCRYLKTDERIDNKVKKIRKNSNVMILGEMILVNSEFQVEIQDINFITMTNTNIGSSTDNSISSLYSDVQATDSNNEELSHSNNELEPNNELNIDDENIDDNPTSLNNNKNNNSNSNKRGSNSPIF